MIRVNLIPSLVAAALVGTIAVSSTVRAEAPASAAPVGVCPANEGRPMPGSHPGTMSAADLPSGMPSAPPAVCPASQSQKLQAGVVAATSPTTAPAPIGSIDLQVKQGTQGGPAIVDVPVTIQLFQDGQPGQKFDVKLDAHGHAAVANIPLTAALEPVVLLEHAGLMQQTIGTTLDGSNPKSQIVMSIYETAPVAPAWSIAMRHVIVHAAPEGLQVTEMLSVSNPTDRIWLGTTQNSVEHATFVLPLAAGLTSMELGGGFQEPYGKVVDNQLVSNMPMFPGAMEFQINYVVPVKDGAAKWTIVGPATVDQLIVFAPADKSTVTVDGAKDSGTMDMGQGAMHMFRGAGIKPGQVVTLSFTGLANVAAAVSATAAPGNWARNVGAIGAVAVVVLGSALLLIRRPGAAVKA